jgi:hypothetical protein
VTILPGIPVPRVATALAVVSGGVAAGNTPPSIHPGPQPEEHTVTDQSHEFQPAVYPPMTGHYEAVDYSHLQPTPDDQLDVPLSIDGVDLRGPDEVTPAPVGVPAGDPTRGLPREQAHVMAPDSIPLPPPAAETGQPAGSLADELAADLAETFAATKTPTATLAIPARDGWFMRFRLDWDEAKTRQWRKDANDPQAPQQISWTKLYRRTIGDQCTAVLKTVETTEGPQQVPVTAGGQILTLRDPRLHRLLGVRGTEAAVHKLLPVFSQLATVGQGIARAAGQDDLIDPFDLS